MTTKREVRQHCGLKQPESVLLRFLRQHDLEPVVEPARSLPGDNQRLLFRGIPTPKVRALSEALTDAFRQAKLMALQKLAAR